MGRSCTAIDEEGVRGFVHTPERAGGAGLALTHGAGANCQSPLLIALADEFCRAGLTVLRYDLPFRQSRPHGPPMAGVAERDRQGVLHAIEWLKKQAPGRVFVGGHSYGGRQTTMLLASRPELAAGLLLLSYPLHPPKRPDQLRTAHFPDLRTPALFVHGTRDGFGTMEEMRKALALIPAQTELCMVEAAGHELLSRKNENELPQRIVVEFAAKFSVTTR